MGFPGRSDSKESACNAGDPVRSLDREDPLEKGIVTHSGILAWRIPGMGGCHLWGHTESDTTDAT